MHRTSSAPAVHAFAATLAVALLGGCMGDGAAGDKPGYYEAVKPILDEHCIGCHTPGGVAPFALTAHADAAPRRLAIAAAVASGVMPPWPAAATMADVSYRGDLRLSAAEKSTIAAWADAGAPVGDPALEPAHPMMAPPTLDRADVTLEMREPFTPKQSPDDYHCFVFDWPLDATVYVDGFMARPGAIEQAHHMAVYLIPPDSLLPGALDLIEEFDAAEPGYGYTCFGGPAGDNDEQVPAQQLAQWVPGVSGGAFPAGTGVEVRPGSKLVLQVHYNTTYDQPVPDVTALDFRVTDTVERAAGFAPWLDLSWVVLGDMRIPAGEPYVAHQAEGRPEAFFPTAGVDLDLSDGFRIHAALLHQHRLGLGGTLAVDHADGRRTTLLEIPRWDFDWQFNYEFAAPVTFAPGDELFLECRWNNSADFQPIVAGERLEPIDVNWGEGTRDEMCVGNLYISVPVTAP